MIVSVRVYVTVFLSLVLLTALTFGVSFLDLGEGNTIVAVTIAFAKATLVALYFMHIRYSDRVIWLAAMAGLFWMGIMIVLTLGDYWARQWLPILK
jgi:cytochrome c oxidase subunit 4